MTNNKLNARQSAIPTITVRMGRRAFKCFLSEIHGNPKDSKDWKKATTVWFDHDLPSVEYSAIEVFATTPIGAVIAMHESTVSEDVIVTMRRPTDGIYRKAKLLVAEAQYA